MERRPFDGKKTAWTVRLPDSEHGNYCQKMVATFSTKHQWVLTINMQMSEYNGDDNYIVKGINKGN